MSYGTKNRKLRFRKIFKKIYLQKTQILYQTQNEPSNKSVFLNFDLSPSILPRNCTINHLEFVHESPFRNEISRQFIILITKYLIFCMKSVFCDKIMVLNFIKISNKIISNDSISKDRIECYRFQ